MTDKNVDHQLSFLIIEDDDDHAFIIERNLKKDPFHNKIHRVRDGVEALEYLKRESSQGGLPDIILLDLKMPRKDGHQVLAEIKENERWRIIPVVILTTSDAEVDKVKAYKHHVNSYLVKPLERDRFQQMLYDLIFYWGVWNKALPINVKTEHERA